TVHKRFGHAVICCTVPGTFLAPTVKYTRLCRRLEIPSEARYDSSVPPATGEQEERAMQAVNPQQSEKQAVFADFAREALKVLLAATLALAWAWASYVGLFDPARVLSSYLVLAVAGLSSVAAYMLSKERLGLAVSVYLLALLVQITVVVSAYADARLLVLYLIVVLVAAPLTRPAGLGLTTLLTVATMAALAAARAIAPVDLIIPLLLTLLTALAAWLSTRRLFTALEWALTMTDHAQRSATEAREHRSELQRVLHSLDLALSRLERSNRALVFAQEAAEKAYRFKSDFVANVSHELRTPLNLIVGFSEMMTTAPESYGGKTLPGEYRGDMLAIYRSSRHLLDLINDVLDLSQIESGRMVIRKERVALTSVIQEATNIVRGLAEARRLQLIVDAPPETLLLYLDRIRIRQVLLNLLTNAMRYTEQGWVRIDAASTADEVTIRVTDSGRGIAPDKLQRAFEAFDRLDEEELTHGSGLGLAVSKKFVDLHEGRMWIDSKLGRGTCVSFTLPLPTQDERLPLSPLRLSQPLRREQERPLVLVIHDDPRAVGLLRRYISPCDFVLAEDVERACALMAAQLPDIVLVEPQFADQWQAAAAATTAGNGALVLVAPLPNVHQVGALLGASDFLPKPVTRDDVAFVLQRLPSRPRTALVIDDDPHIVRLIGRMLRSLIPELHALEAFGGAEGLTIAQTHHPDIIFVDLNMPGMSGQQLIEAVNADPRLASTPIIVVSVRSIEQENAPLQGELRIRRPQGFALSELLALLEITLMGLTQAEATSPANAAARLAALAG
ncbi:MAG TPA: ATP-binding protein, partial [Caldilinea sp.]|nr:ATP-binding protein [Caldilinea sp.]